MLLQPQDESLLKHIDYYWVLSDVGAIFQNNSFVHAFPGITPDLAIVLDGYFTLDYLGKKSIINNGIAFSFIHDRLRVDFSNLKSMILVKFKSKALASLNPFIDFSPQDVMKNSVIAWEQLFGDSVRSLRQSLLNKDERTIGDYLDEWFLSKYSSAKEGFVLEMAESVSAEIDLKTIMEATNYSYSTIERYFKSEAGLTPKKYQSLKRYKGAVAALYDQHPNDWLQLVERFGYYDQSHFIKEIKRFTSFTPAQLSNVPCFVSLRPH